MSLFTCVSRLLWRKVGGVSVPVLSLLFKGHRQFSLTNRIPNQRGKKRNFYVQALAKTSLLVVMCALTTSSECETTFSSNLDHMDEWTSLCCAQAKLYLKKKKAYSVFLFVFIFCSYFFLSLFISEKTRRMFACEWICKYACNVFALTLLIKFVKSRHLLNWIDWIKSLTRLLHNFDEQ